MSWNIHGGCDRLFCSPRRRPSFLARAARSAMHCTRAGRGPLDCRTRPRAGGSGTHSIESTEDTEESAARPRPRPWPQPQPTTLFRGLRRPKPRRRRRLDGSFSTFALSSSSVLSCCLCGDESSLSGLSGDSAIRWKFRPRSAFWYLAADPVRCVRRVTCGGVSRYY